VPLVVDAWCRVLVMPKAAGAGTCTGTSDNFMLASYGAVPVYGLTFGTLIIRPVTTRDTVALLQRVISETLWFDDNDFENPYVVASEVRALRAHCSVWA
jgi:hypothetical protein